MNTWKGKHGPLLIAEIGGNHEGNFEYAEKLTNLAIEADVDFIKFQIYTGDSIVNKIESPDRNAHFKKFELSQEEHLQLKNLCERNNVGYMASIWDIGAIDWIDDYLSIYKIGSGDLTAYSFLKKIAGKNKPIILSTGLATTEEVKAAVSYLQKCNPIYLDPNYLALLQCTAMYPIPAQAANLNVISTLNKETGLPIGYSDHTEGSVALEVAATLGAEILEFHFTDTRNDKVFRDHKVSLTKNEVLQLQDKIKLINTLKGSTTKQPLAIEKEHRISFRRAVYPARDIPKGTVIKEEDLTSLRPAHGISASEIEKIINKKTLVFLNKGQVLDWSCFSS